MKSCNILTISPSYRRSCRDSQTHHGLGHESCQLVRKCELLSGLSLKEGVHRLQVLEHYLISHLTSFSSSKTYLLGTVSGLTVTLILIDMLYPSPSVLWVSHHRKPILCLNVRVPGTPSQVCPCALCSGRSTGEWLKAGERKQLNCIPYLALNRALWNSLSSSCVWRLSYPSSSC